MLFIHAPFWREHILAREHILLRALDGYTRGTQCVYVYINVCM
jgi:hypothetical protein